MATLWDPIVVTWRDAFSSDKRNSKEFIKHKIDPCIRRTVGFLIHQDSDNVVVAGEDDREAMETLDTTDDCESVTVIPTGMVVKIVEMTERRGTRNTAGGP